MLAAIDVKYYPEKAKTVCALFEHWGSEVASAYIVDYSHPTEEYVPGEFYRRELPCILSILSKLDLATVKGIVIDGFVYLDDDGRAGLGAHLYDHLGRTVPVIGVAKKSFHSLTRNVIPVTRGKSLNPLFVTAAGIDLQEAALNIRTMHGQYRIPDILKEVDRRTRVEDQ
jgi:deoxyinosine 3'endonuclease (endonuclease V)